MAALACTRILMPEASWLKLMPSMLAVFLAGLGVGLNVGVGATVGATVATAVATATAVAAATGVGSSTGFPASFLTGDRLIGSSSSAAAAGSRGVARSAALRHRNVIVRSLKSLGMRL